MTLHKLTLEDTEMFPEYILMMKDFYQSLEKFYQKSFLEKFSKDADINVIIEQIKNPFITQNKINWNIQYFNFILNEKASGFLIEKKYVNYPFATWIEDFYIKDKEKGFGSIMMKEFLEKCVQDQHKKVGLAVHEHNNPAIRLYEKFGFLKEGEPNKNSNYFMWKILE